MLILERSEQKTLQEVYFMRENFQPDKYALGISYVPWQSWEKIFDPGPALAAGSAFPCLIMPFCPKGGHR